MNIDKFIEENEEKLFNIANHFEEIVVIETTGRVNFTPEEQKHLSEAIGSMIGRIVTMTSTLSGIIIEIILSLEETDKTTEEKNEALNRYINNIKEDSNSLVPLLIESIHSARRVAHDELVPHLLENNIDLESLLEDTNLGQSMVDDIMKEINNKDDGSQGDSHDTGDKNKDN